MATKSETTNPIITAARTKLRQAIRDGFEAEEPVLIDALPATGKSYSVVQWAAETGRPLTVFTARHDLYNQYKKACAKFGLTFGRVPSYYVDCPLGEKFDGDRPDGAEDWIERFTALYERYGSAKLVHRERKDLPCQQGGECPYMRARKTFNQEFSGYEVVVGHFKHANTPFPGTRTPGRYAENRYVAFDEFPGDAIVETLSEQVFKSSITQYVQESDLPFSNYGEFQAGVHTKKESIIEWKEESRSKTFDLDIAKDVDDVSPHAPLLTQVEASWEYLEHEEDGPNGWLRADLHPVAVAVKSGGDGTVNLLQLPRVGDVAESVICLDGTPTPELWKILFGDSLAIKHVFKTDAEKRKFLADGLGLKIVQTSRNIKPYASGKYLTQQQHPETNEWYESDKQARKDMLVFRWICQQESTNDKPGFISSKKAIEVYEEHGLNDLVAESVHYNAFKGTNDLGAYHFGIVAGCNFPGDDVVQKWAAFANACVRPATNEEGERLKGTKTDFGSDGNPFMWAVRENEVLQAIMRFGRDSDDEGEWWAKVYVETAAIPKWTEADEQVPRPRLWQQGQGMGQVLTVLRESPDFRHSDSEWDGSDMHAAVMERFRSKAKGLRQVNRCLEELWELGYLSREVGEGRGQPWIYQINESNTDEMVLAEDGYVLPPVDS